MILTIVDTGCVNFLPKYHIKGLVTVSYLKNFSIYFYMLPAILIGIITMVANNVSIRIWIQNFLVWVIGSIVGTVSIKRIKSREVTDVRLLSIVVLLIFLVLPLHYASC